MSNCYSRVPLGGLLLSLFVYFGTTQQVSAQSKAVPTDAHYLGIEYFHEGEYGNAMNQFDQAARAGVKTPFGRWVDSICYSTMIGECHFKIGNNAKALSYYDNAVNLFLQHQQWMLRLQISSVPQLGPVSNDRRVGITWGKSLRNTSIGNFPYKIQSLQGNTPEENQRVVERGGIIAPQSLVPIGAAEISRCLALALSRRHEILGSVAKYDALNDSAITALERGFAPPNHWLSRWVDIQLGIAYAAKGKSAQAIQLLQRGVAVNSYDHQLTALALMELGKLAEKEKEFDAAHAHYLEATYAAAAFGQYDIIDEAVQKMNTIQLISKPDVVSPVLIGMSNWAPLRTRNRALKATLNTCLAESHSYTGNIAGANSSLKLAYRAMSRTDMAKGRHGVRYIYIQALVNFQSGNVKAGFASLQGVMQYQRNSSLRLFQISKATQWFVANSLSDHSAQLLFNELLREPTSSDWAFEPLETLSFLLNPNPDAMEFWFNTAIIRKEHELAMEISERIRRMRFFATLGMGGRVTALRWVLESPESGLSTKAKLQRQDLLTKFPIYKQLSERSAVLRNEIKQIPLQAETKEQGVLQKKLFEELAQISNAQEMKLHELALRRDASEFLFPPLYSLKEIRDKLKDDQLVLTFFNTSRSVHVFMFTKKDYVQWNLEDPKEVIKNIKSMLREMGHLKRDITINSSDWKDSEWKEHATTLLKQLIPSLQPGFWDRYTEVTIVPDGPLWYLPFEALQTDDGTGNNTTIPLIEKLAIRYAPTISLAVPEDRNRARPQASALITGLLHRKDKGDKTEEHYQLIKDSFPNQVRLNTRIIPAPTSLYGKVWDELVLLDDVEDADDKYPYGWSPGQIDASKPGSNLASWMRLPLTSPEIVYLPGYHTGAEDSMKRSVLGNEVFLTVLGMMSSGTRTVVLSRWHSGGESSMQVIKGIADKIHTEPASQAWKQAVAALRERTLDPNKEPRVKFANPKVPGIADQPFFWADMMLIDTGVVPVKAAP
ncbi:MAG: hypothetical protein COA78_07615 [Blastopirellula sp.]|nr:MAG: hypothetical protein COA78_07615 [Blastopirellula sp.]